MFVMNRTFTGPLDGCKMLMHSNLCPSGQQTDSKFHCLFLCLPNCELECKSPSACIVFPPWRQPAVPISLARLRQGSATCSPKLLLHLPISCLWPPHITGLFSFPSYLFLSWFLLPQPTFLIPPAASTSSFIKGNPGFMVSSSTLLGTAGRYPETHSSYLQKVHPDVAQLKRA